MSVLSSHGYTYAACEENHYLIHKAIEEDRKPTDEEIIVALQDLFHKIELHSQTYLFSLLSDEGIQQWEKEVRFNTNNKLRNERVEFLRKSCWETKDAADCYACKYLMTHKESWHFKLEKNIRSAKERGDTKRLAELKSKKYPDHPL
mgnify:CR=1 FL=1|tara:strand:+ start:3092 stop:3532 length:441 start_codon:yes stop_codon:yes gene_type:complete